MKLHFESDLDYQLEAIEAVCDLFRGQETGLSEFTVTRKALDGAGTLDFQDDNLGVGNRLKRLDDQILENLRQIQLRNGLQQDATLASGDFTIEMETGTGKTYVYLRTIFELFKRYGFTKFMIVVPTVAIKEGVNKTLQMTRDHFRTLYGGVPFSHFVYDSKKLGEVRNFATSANIQVMVVTVGAINKKDVNNLYKESEKTGGEKPIDLISSTRPIVIVDEPQSVDGGLEGQGKRAIDAMNPLCTLRYSATHKDKHYLVYRLDAVDAYERKLVKQIEVASATVDHAFNRPFVRFVKAQTKDGLTTADVELDVQGATGPTRKKVSVQDGDDLEQVTKRAVYADCRIGEIGSGKKNQGLELRVPNQEVWLSLGEAHGDVNGGAVERELIRRTIREHLDKEIRLRPKGIKVLSLFFIDEVAKYRSYDADGQPVKGEYALIFEEEYRRAANRPEYNTLFQEVDLTHEAGAVHNGYFSIDKKGGWTDTAESNQTGRDSAERAYELIMKEKEKLLSFETSLKFIFSHSALREGWDNPNVFQICVLRNIRTERERRQTIGRGLRLCVNQDGERVRGFETNTLTVIATESYEDFAEKLQKEIEDDTGIRFGVVEKHQFAVLTAVGADGQVKALGSVQSEALWAALTADGMLDKAGKVQDKLRTALKDDTLQLPAGFEPYQEEVTRLLRKLAGRLDIRNADERQKVNPRRAILDSEEFKALWDRIKHKTTYRVDFDPEDLIKSCTQALREAPAIPRVKLRWRKADIAIGKAGVQATGKKGDESVTLDEGDIELPDVLAVLQETTQLTRRSLHRILGDSGRLGDFQKNPQAFIDIAGDSIRRRMQLAIVDGIKYQRVGDEFYYAQTLFEAQDLTGYLRNLVGVEKAPYEQVVFDSEVERRFAEQLEKNQAVKVYAKLPGWFKVGTPLGSYNPDWAVLIQQDDAERLYFVVETKSTTMLDKLRNEERARIHCGEQHFLALGTGAAFIRADSVDTMMDAVD